MKKILDYLGYFLIAAVITIMIVGFGGFIISLIVKNWLCWILVILVINFLLVRGHCKEKNRSPWRIILNLKEKEIQENPKDK